MSNFLRSAVLAGLIALLAGGSTGAEAPRRVEDAPVVAAPPSAPLSMLTYNIAGLPWPIATGRPRALARIAGRLAALRRAGRQPHIVLLQEAFTAEAAAIARDAGYAHAAFGPDRGLRTPVAAGPGDIAYLNAGRWDRGEQIGKRVGSGLVILSDYPIVAVERMAFPDFACAGFDCLANKGVLIAHLAVPGVDRPVAVVDTHLNARGAAGVPIARTLRAYARQAGLMAGFVAAQVPRDRMLLIGGDMNIGHDRERARVFFGAFARAGLDFVTPAQAGSRLALAAGGPADPRALRDLWHAVQRAKDWTFARGRWGGRLAVARADVPFGSEADGAPWSDHFGYVIHYARAAAAPVRLASADL
jgi:endonuclease/exonuclease/phosphatase family metal-dependent hydrolase